MSSNLLSLLEEKILGRCGVKNSNFLLNTSLLENSIKYDYSNLHRHRKSWRSSG